MHKYKYTNINTLELSEILFDFRNMYKKKYLYLIFSISKTYISLFSPFSLSNENIFILDF